MSQPAKLFDLGDVLTITTGLLVSRRHMDGVYEILNHMTGENLYTHQIPRAMRSCKPDLLRQHPQLADVDTASLEKALAASPETMEAATQVVLDWLDRQAAIYGKELRVRPLPPSADGAPDPVQEAIDLVGKDRVIVVERTPEEPA